MGVYEGEWKGRSPGNEPLTLTRCHSWGLPQLNEAFGWKSVWGRAYNLENINEGEISFFFLLLSFFGVDARRPRGLCLIIIIIIMYIFLVGRGLKKWLTV